MPITPPKCKVCGTPHWGTCANHDAKGSLSQQPGAQNATVKARVLKLAKKAAAAVPAKKPKKRKR